jgi:hypothetical protein
VPVNYQGGLNAVCDLRLNGLVTVRVGNVMDLSQWDLAADAKELNLPPEPSTKEYFRASSESSKRAYSKLQRQGLRAALETPGTSFVIREYNPMSGSQVDKGILDEYSTVMDESQDPEVTSTESLLAEERTTFAIEDIQSLPDLTLIRVAPPTEQAVSLRS